MKDGKKKERRIKAIKKKHSGKIGRVKKKATEEQEKNGDFFTNVIQV